MDHDLLDPPTWEKLVDARRKLAIDRLEQIEDRVGVELRGVTAQHAPDDAANEVYVYGEVFATSSGTKRVIVMASVYSTTGEMIGQGSQEILIHRTVGFEPFGMNEIECSRSHGKPERVRLYVKAAVQEWEPDTRDHSDSGWYLIE